MTIVFLINRMSANIIDNQTLFRMLLRFHFIPSTLDIFPKTFGCANYDHIHSLHRDKLDPHALR
jgi:hypothetical protein